MRIEELRIGNYVNSPAFGARPIMVLNKISNMIMTNVDGLETECYEPVPLTKEWLLKFGFEEDESEWAHYYLTFGDLEDYRLNVSLGLNDITIDLSTSTSNNSDDVIYVDSARNVHELQNLFYTLTGYELTIK